MKPFPQEKDHLWEAVFFGQLKSRATFLHTYIHTSVTNPRSLTNYSCNETKKNKYPCIVKLITSV